MESVTRPPTHFSMEKNGRHLTFPLCTSLLYRVTTLDCQLLTDETTHSTNERTVGWLIGWLVGFVSSVVCR